MFDYEYYVNRNKEIAYASYGDLIDENRSVVGTNIWFDKFWRYHNGGIDNV